MKTVLSLGHAFIASVSIAMQLFAQTTAPSSSSVPQYPVAYRVPQAHDIKATLEHMHAHLDQAFVTRIVNSKTKQEITDLSKYLWSLNKDGNSDM